MFEPLNDKIDNSSGKVLQTDAWDVPEAQQTSD